MSKKEEAIAKYQKALRLIEQAENLLSDACGHLCPLKGAIEEWTLVGNAYDKLKEVRRTVAYSSARDNVEMDH